MLTKQLLDENLGIGDNNWVTLAVVEQEHTIQNLTYRFNSKFLSLID